MEPKEQHRPRGVRDLGICYQHKDKGKYKTRLLYDLCPVYFLKLGNEHVWGYPV